MGFQQLLYSMFMLDRPRLKKAQIFID